MKKSADKRSRKWLLVLVIPSIIVCLYVAFVYFYAKPTLSPSFNVSKISATVPDKPISWPSSGQSAVAIGGTSYLETNGVIKPVAMASTAKLVTALCILEKYPLALGQSGPTVTLGPSDVAIYSKYQSEDGSNLIISTGEKLSEYQMLQAMLLPSADNIADSLAIWGFGSLSNYSTYANQFIASHSLVNSHIGLDASGYDPSSTTTASDLIHIGELVMANPVLANIVGQPSASGFPLVGTIKNVNGLLGKDNIIGIKTGNTDQAGGVFLSASKVNVNGQPLTFYSAIMQSPTLFDSMAYTLPLLQSVQANFSAVNGVSFFQKGVEVGQYLVPWSKQTVSIVTSKPLSLVGLGGTKLTKAITLNKITGSVEAGQVVGQMTIRNNALDESLSGNLIVNQRINSPSRAWLLLHPLTIISL